MVDDTEETANEGGGSSNGEEQVVVAIDASSAKGMATCLARSQTRLGPGRVAVVVAAPRCWADTGHARLT